MTEEHPFVPGLEVAYVEDRWGFSMKILKIDKVHKTGRFTLEGSRCQYRPIKGSYDNKWMAYSTARDSWSSGRVEMVTPELIAKGEQAAQVVRVRDAVRRLERINQKAVTREHADALEKMADALCATKRIP